MSDIRECSVDTNQEPEAFVVTLPGEIKRSVELQAHQRGFGKDVARYIESLLFDDGELFYQQASYNIRD